MTDRRDVGKDTGSSAATAARDAAAERIRAAHARSVEAVRLRPARAMGTAVARVAVTDGMTCEVVEGPYRLVVDMPERLGGNGRGPNPGVYGRASLGACLAMTYVRWAAENDLPIRRLEVEIEADYDARGELGVDDGVTPAYTQVRYTVAVETDAPEEEVRRVFDYADRTCPYLHVWTDPLDLRRQLRITRPADAERAGG